MSFAVTYRNVFIKMGLFRFEIPQLRVGKERFGIQNRHMYFLQHDGESCMLFVLVPRLSSFI